MIFFLRVLKYYEFSSKKKLFAATGTAAKRHVNNERIIKAWQFT